MWKAPKDSTLKLLEVIEQFSNVVGYKINAQRSKLKVAEREGVGEWVILVMGIKEGTCHNEH